MIPRLSLQSIRFGLSCLSTAQRPRILFPLGRLHLGSLPRSKLAPQCLPGLSLQHRVLSTDSDGEKQTRESGKAPFIRENIYTIPNLLTISRILACPVLGWAIVHDNFSAATALLVYAGLTDTVDGYIARRFKMTSVLGTILDPAADKTLMTTLTVTLALKGMISVPLAAVILGRDVLLSLSAFYIRYTSLPPPKTFARYWDMSIPSAEVHPTGISKVNTLLQLFLMTATTVSPVLSVDIGSALHALQWVVATTTVWSGASYLFSRDAVRIISSARKPPS